MKLKRMISFALALVILCGTISCIALEANAIEDYRMWAQADSRWGYLPLGASSVTVASHGCLATATTKLIIQAGLKNARSFNVGSFVSWMNDYGGFTASGDMYWGVPDAFGFTNHGDILPYGEYSSSTYNNQLLNWIASGFHLILSVNDSGHYVAVDEAKSLSTGQIHIMDSLPNTANADVALSSRYTTFNSVHAYTGGSTTYNESNVVAHKRSATVISWGANIWSKPYSSGDSKRVYIADKNASLSVVAKVTNSSGDLWYKLTDGNWVYSRNVRITDYNPNDVEAIKKSAVVTSWGANIWSRPYSSDDSKRVYIADKNASLGVVAKVTNSSGDLWYKLTDGNWVYSGNVRITDYNLSDVEAIKKSVVVTSWGANIWSKPYSSGDSCVIKTVAKGANLRVVARVRNSAYNLWYQLYDGGWIYSKNVAVK